MSSTSKMNTNEVMRIKNIQNYNMIIDNGDLILTSKTSFVFSNQIGLEHFESNSGTTESISSYDDEEETEIENEEEEEQYVKPMTYKKIKEIVKTTNFTNSVIIFCKITNSVTNESVSQYRKKYASILKDIWSTMNNDEIYENTTFNIKFVDKNKELGYTWDEDLQLSIQRKDAKGTLKEIINMAEHNNYKISMVIQLKNNNIIKFET
jgi:hypothetical protein